MRSSALSKLLRVGSLGAVSGFATNMLPGTQRSKSILSPDRERPLDAKALRYIPLVEPPRLMSVSTTSIIADNESFGAIGGRKRHVRLDAAISND